MQITNFNGYNELIVSRDLHTRAHTCLIFSNAVCVQCTSTPILVQRLKSTTLFLGKKIRQV